MNATTRFPCHDDASAPREAGPAFEASTAKFGMVPNLIRTMCTSPQLAEGYLALSTLFEQTSLSVAERHVVLLTVSAGHECHYCMAAHSITADMNQVPGEITEALREGRTLADRRLEALRQFTRAMVEQRGWVAPDRVNDFLNAGFTPQQALEVVLGIGLKTLSNYTNHLADTPLDEAFAGRAWQGPGQGR
ncbi:carboxymuconolactone decarboxylase family protein [Thioalkalivibrio thiocyanodenitrificans]|uniref:carboxymuconolactone decarboxylase family protein n=1 Tax=Thioalkalivibrio thiocyanodenitrificans TaxID=243063 RepID=UPI00036248CB|nr:carboxymuconolactone decarboxylase family protein [Thioalkalivibrio thiocyanodenitrificans]